MMTAWLVLASVVVLLALLVHGRISPAILFTSWGGGYFLIGLVDEKTYLAGFTNSALATLIVLLLVSLALERSPILGRLSKILIREGSATVAALKLTGVAAIASAFVNTTAVVGAFLGMVSKQQRVTASKLLIPLYFA